MDIVDDTDDADLQIQRASVGAITDVKSSLTQLLQAYDEDHGHQAPAKGTDPTGDKAYSRIVTQLELFQEQPQLLDQHLKELLPPLVASLLYEIKRQEHALSASRDMKHLNALSRLLYMFCKVRGPKIATRWINEPSRVSTKLQSEATSVSIADTSQCYEMNVEQENNSLGWEYQYIIMLWLSHLMLTPFDLSSIATERSDAKELVYVKLPAAVPTLAVEVLNLSMTFISSATNTQSVAATLLARLALRPDMHTAGLLDVLTTWAISSLSNVASALPSVHTCIGLALFVNCLVASGSMSEVGQHLRAIYDTVYHLCSQDTITSSVFRASAVARKLGIKVLRNLIVKVLQYRGSSTTPPHPVSDVMLQNSNLLEDVIDYLLKALADRDTQVRYAASKSLSFITSKLSSEEAEQVVEAVISALNEDITDRDDLRSVEAVDPLRWHGLTLTLSYILFRRSAVPSQLPDILKALYLALTFNQNSPIGSPIGGNVRDAANFGLWSLARRYTTTELLSVNFERLQAPKIGRTPSETAIQRTASELVVAACLDPVGNVRRGSSAALQELVGRHPDTITEGIALVQVVDYHAVGLRRRAMVDVALSAANLGETYEDALVEGLFGWRGVCAPDRTFRNTAGSAIGRMSELHDARAAVELIRRIVSILLNTQGLRPEPRHGLVQSMAAILIEQEKKTHFCSNRVGESQKQHLLDLLQCCQFQHLLEGPLRLTQKDMTSSSARPELSAEAVISLVHATAACVLRLKQFQVINEESTAFSPAFPNDSVAQTLSLSLRTLDKINLENVPRACKLFCLSQNNQSETVRTWVENCKSTKSPRNFGIMLALGSAWGTLVTGKAGVAPQVFRQLRDDIVDLLIRAFDTQNTDLRVIVIRSLSQIIDSLAESNSHENIKERILTVVASGLHDYTVNEQGDVGSLVRSEALELVNHLWSSKIKISSFSEEAIYWAVQRLSLERLDKLRLHAARCLNKRDSRAIARITNVGDVSTYEYFSDMAAFVLNDWRAYKLLNSKVFPDQPVKALRALLEGFASSTGAGSESLIQVARSALLDAFSSLPIDLLERTSLLTVAEVLVELFKENLQNERVLLPLLEMTGFLFDARLIQPVASTSFKWRNLLSVVQKAHFKSTNIAKLLAAVNLYRNLAEIDVIRNEVLVKLSGMLLHPFPRIRVAVAETLFVLTIDDELKQRDWSAPVNQLSSFVNVFKLLQNLP